MSAPTTSSDEPGPELIALAALSIRSGIPLPDLVDLEPIYLNAYFAALEEEAAANRK